MIQFNRWLVRSLLALSAFLLITACQDTVSNLPSTPLATLQSDTGCRMVTHELGETQVCGKPQRIAALSPHILDSILALGVQPLAYAEVMALPLNIFDRPHEQIPYLGDRVTTQPVNLGDRQSPSLEKLLLLKPDLILGESWNNEGIYPLLSQIAPTLLFSDIKGDHQSWKNDISGIAEAVDQESQVEKLFAKQQQTIEKTRAKLASILATHPKVLILSVDATLNNIMIHADSTAGALLKELGFELVSSQAIPGGDSGTIPISVEIVPTLNADHIIVMAWDPSNIYRPQDHLKTAWEKNPILQAHPASKMGRVYFVDYQLWGSVTRGPITDQLILETLPELLVAQPN
ncbi:ABC transporter substrate-binding protein [Leptolyngbya sp. PL-A3]|uniref:ABC transporter substrate-binding protein n=1 Tax=Leptolyngbya sp. PL-A3 TaxID=2933911 RepID=UPI003298FB53